MKKSPNKSEKLIEHLLPWAGIVAAGVGWSLAHQVGSNAVFDDCRTGTALFILLVNLAGLALSVGGGFFSWRIWSRGEDETEGRRFLGLVGLLVAALLSFTIVLQAISGLLLPRCLS